ncbi:MAG: hypothetical protein IJJ99_01610 [Oscillospiraceae bacterium]|nr:hypothetical protein [Oscillospiraceae bacterium]
MKKLTAIILALAVLLSLAACGGEAKPDIYYGKYLCYKITMLGEDCPVDGEWLRLDSDGTGRLGISLEVGMEWTLDGEELTIDALGGPYKGTLKDDRLALDWGGTMMYFAPPDQIEPSDEPEPASLLSTEESEQIPYTEPAEPDYSTASVIDAATEGLKHDGIRMEFHVPKIVFDGEGIDYLNEIIYEQLYDGVYQEYVVKSMDEYGMPGICSMDYIWGISGEYLSIVVNYAYYASEGSDFFICNVDLSNGKFASDVEVLSHFGYTVDSFNARAKDVMGSVLFDQYASFLEEVEADPSLKPDLDDLVKRTTSEEYVSDACPFVGPDGKLWMVAPIASIAGADRYMQVIAFESYPISEAYLSYIAE